jgi:acyl carrier protein
MINAEELVWAELQALRESKGLSAIVFKPDSVLLGEALGLDSLDLATLVVTLEERTGRRPFDNGFVMFQTVGELVNLFSGP